MKRKRQRRENRSRRRENTKLLSYLSVSLERACVPAGASHRPGLAVEQAGSNPQSGGRVSTKMAAAAAAEVVTEPPADISLVIGEQILNLLF